MLPMALDALLDVMTTSIDEDRLEKEVRINAVFAYRADYAMCRGPLFYRKPAWLTKWSIELNVRFFHRFTGLFLFIL